MIGAAKNTSQWSARLVAFSAGAGAAAAAQLFGNLTRWGVALATLVLDNIGGSGRAVNFHQIAEARVMGVTDALAPASASDAVLHCNSRTGHMVSGFQSDGLPSTRDASLDIDRDIRVATSKALESTEEYVQQCPALAHGDTTGYASDDDDDDDDTEGEDAAQVLEGILPYLEMAVAAYNSTSMSEQFEKIQRRQLISNVIDPTRLFGLVGITDTEVHVCILDDRSVVLAFRGTEPTEWLNGFADVLTDLAQGQATVKLYDGSSEPVHTSEQHMRVHRGFQNALKDVTDTSIPSQNLRLVLEGLGMQAEDVSDVVCVGHSLGGALATLCAKWCREVAFPRAKIGCVTIGSPRVGNAAFAADFNSRVVDGLSYRVVNKHDVVPSIPNLITYPAFGSPYKHVSKPIYLCADEAGEMTARLGGGRPTNFNLSFVDHRGRSYLDSAQQVLQYLAERRYSNSTIDRSE